MLSFNNGLPKKRERLQSHKQKIKERGAKDDFPLLHGYSKKNQTEKLRRDKNPCPLKVFL